MSAALLVCAAPLSGHLAYYRRLIVDHCGLLIAVDGGADLCLRVGRAPDVLVGDLDSISATARAFAESGSGTVVPAPADKDVSDLDLALAFAREAGEERVVVTAAWSGRLDHTLAAVGSVLHARSLTIDLDDPGMTGGVLDSSGRASVRLEGPGSTFSLFTVDPTSLVTCIGTRYPLTRHTLGPLSSLGLSNVVLEGGAVIIAEQGRLLWVSHSVETVRPARMLLDS